MARNTNNSTKRTWEEVCEGVSVMRGKDDRFSIDWFGAVIHGCRLVTGKNGAFIGWPSFKGRDNTYVKTAYVFARKDDENDKILTEVINYLLEK